MWWNSQLCSTHRLPYRRRFYKPLNWHPSFPCANRMASYLIKANYLKGDEDLFLVVIRTYNQRYYDNDMVIFSRRGIEDSYHTVEENGLRLTRGERSTCMIWPSAAYYATPNY